MRKYKRRIAHARMSKEGILHQNKPQRGLKSYFALNWRKYVGEEKAKKAKRTHERSR